MVQNWNNCECVLTIQKWHTKVSMLVNLKCLLPKYMGKTVGDDLTVSETVFPRQDSWGSLRQYSPHMSVREVWDYSPHKTVEGTQWDRTHLTKTVIMAITETVFTSQDSWNDRHWDSIHLIRQLRWLNETEFTWQWQLRWPSLRQYHLTRHLQVTVRRQHSAGIDWHSPCQLNLSNLTWRLVIC